MAWDLAKNTTTGDLTGGIVTGQAEILQRVETRLRRHLGEWFVNTGSGIPWYKGWSNILPGELSEDTAILGSRDISGAELSIRSEILATDGVLYLVDFNSVFSTSSRELRILAKIATLYGLAYLRLDHVVR